MVWTGGWTGEGEVLGGRWRGGLELGRGRGRVGWIEAGAFSRGEVLRGRVVEMTLLLLLGRWLWLWRRDVREELRLLDGIGGGRRCDRLRHIGLRVGRGGLVRVVGRGGRRGGGRGMVLRLHLLQLLLLLLPLPLRPVPVVGVQRILFCCPRLRRRPLSPVRPWLLLLLLLLLLGPVGRVVRGRCLRHKRILVHAVQSAIFPVASLSSSDAARGCASVLFLNPLAL